jgi:HAD superfamily hydrolase (TIGR01509 family)
MTIEALLFDIDGTLVDSNDLHVEAWMEVFGRHGLSPDRDAVRAQIGKGGDLLVPSLFPDRSEAEQEAMADGHGEVFKARFLDRVQPFPDAAALVRRAHEAGLKVALASSASQSELEHYVGLLGLKSAVDATTTIDDVEQSKPAADIFAVAVRKLGVAPERTLAIGDTPYDVEAAAKAGVRTVAVLSGGFARADLGDAAGVYDDVAELLRRWPEWVRA